MTEGVEASEGARLRAAVAQPGAQAVLALLEGAGHAALVVGGCVRNALLGLPPGDIDIATDAPPERVMALAEAAGLRALPTGIDHGTVTILAHGAPHEVTTFRRDVATDGRHATVAFTPRIEEDAARRDFTMNALYADRRGRVTDPLGGLPDLRARRVRFVGDPGARIAEDRLRILRFFRFHAAHGDPAGGIDAEGLAACAAGAEGLAQLSRERVGAEMRKLLAAPDPAPAVAAMAAAGVLGQVLPGADPAPLAPLVHLEGGRPPAWMRRAAALGGEGVEARWRLSRAEGRGVAARREAALGAQGPAALGHLLGAEAGVDALLVRAALLTTPPPPGWEGEVARGAATPFPVTAADLVPLAGPALGQRLAALKEAWLAADLRPSRDELLR
jgi:poly(A) polymerase